MKKLFLSIVFIYFLGNNLFAQNTPSLLINLYDGNTDTVALAEIDSMEMAVYYAHLRIYKTDGSLLKYFNFFSNQSCAFHLSNNPDVENCFIDASFLLFPPSIFNLPSTNLSLSSATIGLNIENDGGDNISYVAMLYSTDSTLQSIDSVIVLNNDTGVQNINLFDLSPSTSYYYYAFAVNDIDTSYTDTLSFTTASILLPEITTDSFTNVNDFSALLYGTLLSNGGDTNTIKGFVWSEHPNPTIQDSVIDLGTHSGAYFYQLNNLQANTTYYFKAFAQNSEGVSYGNEMQFTTLFAPGGPCNQQNIVHFNGFDYPLIEIGNQCWIAKNLQTKKFKNGDDITDGNFQSIWTQSQSSQWNVFSDVLNDTNLTNDFGLLYNWRTVVDYRAICPPGFKVPSQSDWDILGLYIDPNSDTTCSSCEVNSNGGELLKDTSSTLWNPPNPANNQLGFNGVGAGSRANNGNFLNHKDVGFYWSSTDVNFTSAWVRRLVYNSSSLFRNFTNQNVGLSCRCLKNDSSEFVLPTVYLDKIAFVTDSSAVFQGNLDNDGNSEIISMGFVFDTLPSPDLNTNSILINTTYNTFKLGVDSLLNNTTYYVRSFATNALGTNYSNEISFTTENTSSPCNGLQSILYQGKEYALTEIGNQCWFAENLSVSAYRDGTTIPNITINSNWGNLNTGAWSHNLNAVAHEEVYGKIYNWHAVNNVRGLCPSGWKVPDDNDWNELVSSLDTLADTSCFNCVASFNAGESLKSSGNSRWLFMNNMANNSTGFNALPGGSRNGNTGITSGNFNNIGTVAVWWSSTAHGTNSTHVRSVSLNNGEFNVSNQTREAGHSVRCIKIQ